MLKAIRKESIFSESEHAVMTLLMDGGPRSYADMHEVVGISRSGAKTLAYKLKLRGFVERTDPWCSDRKGGFRGCGRDAKAKFRITPLGRDAVLTEGRIHALISEFEERAQARRSASAALAEAEGQDAVVLAF